MKVAIPLFGSRVSPRFDCGAEMLLAEVEDGAARTVGQVPDGEGNPLQRVAHLRELGVNAVICGAVTGFLLRHLAANGIRVFPWVFCEASEALDAFARGELPRTLPWGAGRGRGACRRGMGRCSPRWHR